MKKIAIMASGNGTNAENLIKQMQAGRIPAEPVIVISDRPEAGVLKRAAALGVEAALVDRKAFPSRDAYEVEIIRHLDEKKADLIALAGYMRILSDAFVHRFWGRIVNIHPAMLPAFPGAHAIQDAFEAGVRETGVTVHFVDTGVDTGAKILQHAVKVAPSDSLDSLEAKIHSVEYELYPEALNLVLSGKVRPPKAPSSS